MGVVGCQIVAIAAIALSARQTTALTTSSRRASDVFDDTANAIGPGERMTRAPTAAAQDATNPRRAFLGGAAAAGAPAGESGFQFFPAQSWRSAAMKHSMDSARHMFGGGGADHCQDRHLRHNGCTSPSMTRHSPMQCQVEATDLQGVACPAVGSHPLECCLPGAESEMPSGCIPLCRRFCGCCQDALSPDSVMAAQHLALPIQQVCVPPTPYLAHALGSYWPAAAQIPSHMDHLRREINRAEAIETGEMQVHHVLVHTQQTQTVNAHRAMVHAAPDTQQMRVHHAMTHGAEEEEEEEEADGEILGARRKHRHGAGSVIHGHQQQ